MNAADVLRDRFGFDRFQPGQQEVIEHLLAGRSAAAVFPTGGGKSLCYQLPALMLPGVTLVVSPLIALMTDQVDRLRERGIAAERLDSTRTSAEVAQISSDLRAGRLKLLYVAPERLHNERLRSLLEKVQVSLLAIDEAHCISEWGHAFRPEYLKLAPYAERVGAERVLALTATATPQVLDDICRGLDISTSCAVRTPFYRENLALHVSPVAASQREAVLLERMRQRPAGPTIVYVTLQRTAEAVAQRLAAAGFDARPYHAGLNNELRAQTQDWFMNSSRGIVVATIAFGMGIDKADIRYVYHYNLPKSLESYAQEVGRSGRDGAPAACEMLACPDDLCALENFAYGDTPAPSNVRNLVRELFSLGTEFDLSPYDVSNRHDIRPLVLNTLLAYLELEGFLAAGTPFYSECKFQPLAPSSEILSRFEGERRDFVAAILKLATKRKIWFSIDLEQAASVTASTRDRVLKALDYLAERGWLELQLSGLRSRFRRLKPAGDVDRLAATLQRRMVDRETRETGRLSQVLEWAGADECLADRLCRHFGDADRRDCGRCSFCQRGQRAALLPRASSRISDAVWHKAAAVRARNIDPLADPRSFAKFLCGLNSPCLTRAKLSSDPLFGELAEAPFLEVLRRAEQGAAHQGMAHEEPADAPASRPSSKGTSSKGTDGAAAKTGAATAPTSRADSAAGHAKDPRPRQTSRPQTRP